MTVLDGAEVLDDFAALGVRAFTTSRHAGTFGLSGADPVGEVMARWRSLRDALGPAGSRVASATQVHGARVVEHGRGWEGWLRVDAADGHLTTERNTTLVVSIADCVPIFLADPAGRIAILHSGWRGTAARIVDRGIDALVARGADPATIRLHCGPAICGTCYEVGADVRAQLLGPDYHQQGTVDLRALIAEHARARGVQHVTISPACTRCNNDRFFSHRCGDAGRQLGVIALD